MLITSCGNSEKLARELARKLKARYTPLTLSAFPDGDIYLKFNTSLKGKTLTIVQSFQPNPAASLLNVMFAAETAKDIGAKRVILVAPYLAYLRQDARFHPGEAVSSKTVGKWLSQCLDKVITFDPHIHRYKSLRDIFSISATRLTANPLIADYLKKHLKNSVIVGPDWESYQWAEKIAKQLGAEATVFEKKRYSSWQVEVKMVKPVPIRGKNIFIVDDIISTGHTIREAAKKLKQMGAKSITAICIHPVFVGKAAEKLRKAGVTRLISTNCIEHPTNGIDVTPLLVKELSKEQ